MPFSVFTKPWKTMPLEQLATFVRSLAFDGVELPVRDGFQVQPQNVATQLPLAAKVFADAGLKIFSVAGSMDEPMIDACAIAEIPVIRICLGIDPTKGYRAGIDQFRRKCESLQPALRRANVSIGLQNHHGDDIGSAVGVIDAIAPLDPSHVSAVLDVAHCALAGGPEEVALDIAWPRLCMVNLKNGYRRRVEDGPNGEARWKVTWCGAKEGFASWSKTIESLRQRGYDKPICLTAEYSDGIPLDQTIAQDIAYAQSLLRTRQD